MTIIIKTEEQIADLREGGKRLGKILAEVATHVKPGISTLELDRIAHDLIKEGGDKPAFLGYQPYGHKKPFPAALCTSVNSEIVHGIPRASVILEEGDIISIDLGLVHKGLFTDHAVTVAVGEVPKSSEKLLKITKEALDVGIWAAKCGNTVGDIGYAIESFVYKRYGIVKELAGHGVGVEIHEDPYVPNYGKAGKGVKLVPGMVIAIEPMLTLGSPEIHVLEDGYTIKTADGSRAAHFEHTVLITTGDAEILTTF